jgi:hypothetical protein
LNTGEKNMTEMPDIFGIRRIEEPGRRDKIMVEFAARIHENETA